MLPSQRINDEATDRTAIYSVLVDMDDAFNREFPFNIRDIADGVNALIFEGRNFCHIREDIQLHEVVRLWPLLKLDIIVLH